MSDEHRRSPAPATPRFDEVLRARLSRRRVIAGGLATAAATFLAVTCDTDPQGPDGGAGGRRPPRRGLIGFAPAANTGGPDPSISEDYQWYPILPWGTALFAGAPDFDAIDTTTNTWQAQERQAGIGHDGMWLFPDWGSSSRGVLCLNNEFGDNMVVLGRPLPVSADDVRKSQAAHGVTIVELVRRGGRWQPIVPGRRNRRIHVNTPVTFGGPAAGSELLETAAANAPAGTVNNCAYGHTPWGTYLTCEENFNGYFGATGEWTPTAAQERYGFSAGGSGYGWHLFDARFDLADPCHRNEEHRFGWVVEIDPQDPSSTPVKRTALGRMKHEGATATVGRGCRVVVYMGDDETGDYIYKFVSSGNWRWMRARGISPLDEGTLHVARFADDGTGEWLPLTVDNPALAGWSLDRILVHTRLAADAVGATRMDRPEWTTVDRSGRVYCTLTNNTDRTVPDAANPMASNPDGHIIRWHDADDHLGTTFEWDIFLLARDTRGVEAAEFTDPDGIWADPDGRVFVETDGGQPNGRNNQLVVVDSHTGEIRRLFAGVSGDEITGLTVTPDRRTLLVNIQHPGDGDRARSNFPAPGAGGPEVPRDSTIVITRRDGGTVGE